MFRAAVLAVYGIFCDFLSALMAKYGFFVALRRRGFACFAHRAYDVLNVLFVCVEKYAADFGCEFGHRRHYEREERQKERNHSANCADNRHCDCAASGKKRLVRIVAERTCHHERVYAERKKHDSENDGEAPHDSHSFDHFIQIFRIVVYIHIRTSFEVIN